MFSNGERSLDVGDRVVMHSHPFAEIRKDQGSGIIRDPHLGVTLGWEEHMLSMKEFGRIAAAAQAVVAQRGADYYGWVNAPEAKADGTLTHTSGWGDSAETREVSGAEALGIMSQKLDGAYGERFVTSLGMVAALVANGYAVRFVQFRAEPGVPFDAAGWTVMVIETMPIFHISPDDLRLQDVADVVEILDDNSAPEVCWKQTNKVGEFAALLAGASEPGLDLVAIAKAAS